MRTVTIELPDDVERFAQLHGEELAHATRRLWALELLRTDKVSLGRAADISGMGYVAFMDYASEHGVPVPYGSEELAEDRKMLDRLGL